MANQQLPVLLACIAALCVMTPGQTDLAKLWNERAEVAQQSLADGFWEEGADLFAIALPRNPEETRFHYWWQAHAIDVLVDGFERTQNRAYLTRAMKLWNGVKRRNGGVVIDYYDDMLWMAIALQRLQAHSVDSGSRGDVNKLWSEIKAGWSDKQGGGIAWSKLHPEYKNTPANAPAVILGVRLYRERGEEADLRFAKRVYEWLDQNLVDTDTGLVWDGKNRNGDGKTDKDWSFTYNQGVRIGASVELYRATQDERYLADATKTLEATLARLLNGDGMLVERGKGDGGLFKGILVRYVGELVALAPNERTKEREFLRRQAEEVWSRLAVGSGADGAPPWFPADWNHRAEDAVQPSAEHPVQPRLELSVQLSGVMLTEQMAKLSRGVKSPLDKTAEPRRVPR